MSEFAAAGTAEVSVIPRNNSIGIAVWTMHYAALSIGSRRSRSSRSERRFRQSACRPCSLQQLPLLLRGEFPESLRSFFGGLLLKKAGGKACIPSTTRMTSVFDMGASRPYRALSDHTDLHGFYGQSPLPCQSVAVRVRHVPKAQIVCHPDRTHGSGPNRSSPRAGACIS